MSDGTADEARKSLGARIAGKAKELAGAVTGNNALAAEGQLQQAEAAARREASAQQAVAQAEAAEAAQQLAEEQQQAGRERRAAEAAAEA
ncbi:MAG: ral stress protein CsbD, partial [Mycobacterium sp.]|nr:ral stress protein CsbD [Mycobacterium sp.]